MRVEMASQWRGLMTTSVAWLVEKHRRSRMEDVPDTWRGIKVSDQALGDTIQLPPPFLSNDIQGVSEAAKAVLRLPPKTAVYIKISMEDIQMEVYKAIDVKARWEDIDREQREAAMQTREEAMEEERVEGQVYNKKDGKLMMHRMKVTKLPTNKEMILPDERPDEVEVGLQGFGAEVLEVSRKYMLIIKEMSRKAISPKHKRPG